ncbi:MAG: AvaI/BsoBI family type II restriction endonuclease [Collinsella sp.]
MKNNRFIESSKDLVTTRDARRSGFLEYALRRNKESIPFIDKAKALQVCLQKNTKCAEENQRDSFLAALLPPCHQN